MADLNTMIHEVCEYEGLALRHIFRFKPGGFQFHLGMDRNGYIFHVIDKPSRSRTSVVNSSSTGQGQKVLDSFSSSSMTEFSARLLGALGPIISPHDSNCDVAEWLKRELKEYLSKERGLVGTISYHWKKRREQD